MPRPKHEEQLAGVMARRTGTSPDDWYLVFKARYGMQLAFEAIARELGGGAVATQLLTCCTAVDPILVAGLEPVYSEVSASTAAIDPLKMARCDGLRAVVLQHTYGIIDVPSSIELADAAHAAGAVLVEDCAHCVGRMAARGDGSPVADISIHSFGVEKMLDSHFGGVVWVNPRSEFAGVVRSLREALDALPEPPARLDFLARAYLTENRVLVHSPRALSRWLRRALPALGLFEPAVSEEERSGTLSRKAYRPSRRICAQAAEALDGLDARLAQHAAAVAVYRDAFAAMPGVRPLAATMDGPVQPLLRFPILVRDTATADRVTAAVCAAGYYTTAWYRPELGPGVLDASAYRLPRDRSHLRVCDELVACVATLPANISVDGAREVSRVVAGVVSS